ncbi:MAG TPA: carboxypeptidase regulatory-like domain-containing protein [Candidatus Polarisedimenticolia bacterium]|jgi:outer membrane receptor protein involved in Fe transport|nr:carboxypeptidase regulatory-like domain-containing protein [Candidatus Polarisedimenticolia bacterium]
MARRGHRPIVLLVVLIAWMRLSGIVAWALPLTGSLEGTVVDRDGHPLAGVTVVLENTSLGHEPRGTVTNAQGEFRFLSIPLGKGYALRVSLPSYQTLVFREVEVLSDANPLPNITLPPALTEKVEVRAKPDVVRTESATTSTTISSQFLAGLPVLGRDYQDILTLAPGVTDVDNTGNPNIHGARDTDVVTLVDGVNTTDPFTGRYGQELNVESIQEIEVITAGASAQFSRASGGFVNIVTKSGGNEFKGTFKFFMRTSRLDGDGAGTDAVDLRGGLGEPDGFRNRKFSDLYPFLSLSGALVKNHLWYYLAPEFVQIEEPINSGTQTYVAATRAVRAMGKVTWQVASANRLDFVALYDDTHVDNQGLTSRTALESGYAIGRGGPTLTLRDTAIITPNFSVETTVSRFDQSFAVIPTLDADTNGNGLLFTDGIPGLGNNDGFWNARERDPGEDYDRDGRYDVYEDLNGNGRLDGCLRDPTTGTKVCFPPEGAVAPWDGLLHFGEDRDRDGRLTLYEGCEGKDHEDLNCNGLIDAEVDLNRNGLADPKEDTGIFCQDRVFCPDGYEPGTRGNGRLDTEDRNGDTMLNTMPGAGATPFPFWTDKDGDGIPDPGEFHAPLPQDRDYLLSVKTNRISGPFYSDYRDSRTRDTLKEEISAYAGDLMGSHDLKIGMIFEKEGFDRTTHQRPFLQITPPRGNAFTFVPGKVGALLPTQNTVDNMAESDHLGFYLQDSYKPLPNLALGLGLRFDREVVRSQGYESFDPVAQRQAFDLLMALRGIETTSGDLDVDGVVEVGLQGDPLYAAQDTRWAGIESALVEIAPRRLTRHNFLTSIESARLARFGISDPDLLLNGHPRQPEEIEISNNNLAPRLSVSWDPQSDGKSKVFASWGRFYGNLFLETVVGEQGPDTISPYYTYDQDGLSPSGLPDNQAGRTLAFPPPSAYQVDRGLRTPFTDELTAGIYREIAPEISISLTYVRRDYRDQLQDVDVNHSTRRAPQCKGRPTSSGLCDDFGVFLTPSGFFSPQSVPDGYPDLFVNNFNFNQIFRVGNYNVQAYSSYEVHLTRRLRRKWQLDASYVYSQATGQAESFLSESGSDPSLTELKSGYLAYDQRHVAKLHAVAFLPSDWQIGGAITWSSGLPFSLVNRVRSSDDVLYPQNRTLFGRRDITTGKFYAESRNIHRNHAVYDINVRTQRNFVIGHMSAGAFFEVFNLLNTDDLRITEIDNSVDSLQAEETRRFGRRFQIGIQMDF